MKVIKKTKYNGLATVYIAESGSGKHFEFVESTQPPFTRQQKWVLVVSTLYGCPVDCRFCDAGGNYKGKLSYEDLLFQIDYLIREYYPDGSVTCDKFKVQFARMGEPSFNPHVLKLLTDLPGLYELPGFIPSLSTIAPKGTQRFFRELLEIKKAQYPLTFQLQFSIHSTLSAQRDNLIPVKKWNFNDIAYYGKHFFNPGGRKITLNFILTTATVLDPGVLKCYFDPDVFCIKLTPLNPTYKANISGLKTFITPETRSIEVADRVREAGYEVLLSIGEWEENRIGSNCGQYVQSHARSCKSLPEAYNYEMIEMD